MEHYYMIQINLNKINSAPNNDKMSKAYKIALLIVMLFLPVVGFSQTAGSMISGKVFDNEGPLSLANVMEIDAANRIVAHATTDVNGNFSFKLINPKDRIKVTFVGYNTVILPITGTNYNIKMVSSTTLQEVVVSGRVVNEGSGLAIPKREMSGATQKIEASEFAGLGITTIDEALQGRIAGLDIVYNSGNLGSGTSMRLRGAASINASSEPLVVVDGNVWQSSELNNFDFPRQTMKNLLNY
jgi:hypothetical protein